MKKTILALILATSLFGCKKDKNENPEPEDKSYTVPTTYNFVDANNNSTVNFDGQKQRLEMLSEISAYIKTGNTKGTVLDAGQLKNMYANSSYTWTDANGLGMTGSSKQLKDKTVSGDVAITSLFETYFDSLATISAYNRDGAPGTSGVYPQEGSKGPYLMNANGQEYAQLVEKGLMCAVFYNQITTLYLSSTKMDVDNTSPVDAANGKHYTIMEHHWDEAFGYFSFETNYPTAGTDRFWGKYAKGREALLQSSTKIMNAFLKGRAAISNKDLTTRDVQIKIIRDELEKACAATAIHYLNEAHSNISTVIIRNHSLSEAYAFIDGLKYGYNSINNVSISKSDVETILTNLGSDFNNITAQQITDAKNALSSKFGFDNIKDQL